MPLNKQDARLVPSRNLAHAAPSALIVIRTVNLMATAENWLANASAGQFGNQGGSGNSDQPSSLTGR